MSAEPTHPLDPDETSNPVIDRSRPVLTDAELGGEAPCFAHLFEDEDGDELGQSGRV